jgi:hypothetical protein
MGLKQWARENSKFLKLDDGETINVKYEGYVMSLNQNQEEVPSFKFRTQAGKVQIMQTRNSAFLNAFDEEDGKFKKGDHVMITRHGMKQQTTYEVEPGTIS